MDKNYYEYCVNTGTLLALEQQLTLCMYT